MKAATQEHEAEPADSEARRGFYRFAWWVVNGFTRLYFRLEARGVAHVPATGPAILVANHVSYLDPPLIGCLIPRVVHVLARESLFRIPVLGGLIRLLRAVPVDREAGSAGLRAILDRLQAGGAIIVFPEGTRALDGKLQGAKAGIGMAILKSTAPLVPVRLDGTFAAMGRGRWFPRPYKVIIHFGRPEYFAAARMEAETCSKPRLKVLYQEVADEVMRQIASAGEPSC